MNKLVLSALAASVAIGTTNASEGDWAGLDAELNTLSSSLDSHGGPVVSGYLEATYDTVGVAASPATDAVVDDLTTIHIDESAEAADAIAESSTFSNARSGLSVSGSSGGYGYHVDINATGGTDAYLTFEMGGIGWTMGEFRAPTTGNHLADEEDMHFMDRSALGGSGARTNGLMASGNADALGYMIHVSDDEEFSARLTYDVMTGEGINLSVAYSMDDAADTSWMEANLSSGPFGLHVTTGDADIAGVGADEIAGTDDDDDLSDSAMVITASYDVNDTWSIGLRQTDQDDGVDETMDWAITYNDGGARWTFQTNDDDDLAIGCIVGF